jgi:hypothetical protein
VETWKFAIRPHGTDCGLQAKAGSKAARLKEHFQLRESTCKGLETLFVGELDSSSSIKVEGEASVWVSGLSAAAAIVNPASLQGSALFCFGSDVPSKRTRSVKSIPENTFKD